MEERDTPVLRAVSECSFWFSLLCWKLSLWRFGHDSTSVEPYGELSVSVRVFSLFGSIVCKSKFWHIPRAEHALAQNGACQKLSMQLHLVGAHSEQCWYLHNSSCIDTLCVSACVCICWGLSTCICRYCKLVVLCYSSCLHLQAPGALDVSAFYG